jgi:hypothetical protein
MEVASLTLTLLGIDAALALGTLPPERDDLLQLGRRMDACCAHQLLLCACEGFGLGFPGLDQEPHGTEGDLSVDQRASSERHRPQRSSRLEVCPGATPWNAVHGCQPARSGQMPVTLVQASSFDLRQSAQPLQFEAFDRSVQFAEVLFDASVGHLSQRLRLELIDRGTKFAHLATSPNMRSKCSPRVRH